MPFINNGFPEIELDFLLNIPFNGFLVHNRQDIISPRGKEFLKMGFVKDDISVQGLRTKECA